MVDDLPDLPDLPEGDAAAEPADPPTVLPAEVVTALVGEAVVGAWEPAHLLLTVDAQEVPDVCLLSRTELGTAGDRVRAVVASRKARGNLARTGTATLVVWAGRLYYLAARVVRTAEVGGAVGYELVVTRVLHDDIGVNLAPMRFHVEPWLSGVEQWERSATAFRLLDETGGAGEPSGAGGTGGAGFPGPLSGPSSISGA